MVSRCDTRQRWNLVAEAAEPTHWHLLSALPVPGFQLIVLNVDSEIQAAWCVGCFCQLNEFSQSTNQLHHGSSHRNLAMAGHLGFFSIINFHSSYRLSRQPPGLWVCFGPLFALPSGDAEWKWHQTASHGLRPGSRRITRFHGLERRFAARCALVEKKR